MLFVLLDEVVAVCGTMDAAGFATVALDGVGVFVGFDFVLVFVVGSVDVSNVVEHVGVGYSSVQLNSKPKFGELGRHSGPSVVPIKLLSLLQIQSVELH